MAYAGSTVHIGCAFSIIEILASLHQNFLRYPHNDPLNAQRDYLVLSKGHGVMAQYACMRERTWLKQEQLDHYFSDATELKGLSDSRVPGLEVTSGSLGHGFSVAVGMALGAKLKSSGQRTFVIVGDGEINEGPIWEGAMFAAHHRLKDFITIVDANGFQAMGSTNDIVALEDIGAKFSAFGFEVANTDGHDALHIERAITRLIDSESDRPKALIAKTIKGKGVSFMENDNRWHYMRLDQALFNQAMQELMP
jgi:transketolase